jgi:hypothetical protein
VREILPGPRDLPLDRIAEATASPGPIARRSGVARLRRIRGTGTDFVR